MPTRDARWNHFRKSKFDDVSSRGAVRSTRTYVEGAAVLRALPLQANEGGVPLYVRLLCSQLRFAPLDDIQKLFVSVSLNLPASARTINTLRPAPLPLTLLQAGALPPLVQFVKASGGGGAVEDRSAGLCSTHASLRHTGDVLLAMCVGSVQHRLQAPNRDPTRDQAASAQQQGADGMFATLATKLGASLVRRLDFAASDPSARDIHLEQLFQLIGWCQQADVAVSDVVTDVAARIGVLAAEYNALAALETLPVTAAPFHKASVAAAGQGRKHPGPQKASTTDQHAAMTHDLHTRVKLQLRHTKLSLAECLAHVSEVWKCSKSSEPTRKITSREVCLGMCDEYRLVGATKGDGLCAILSMRVSFADQLQKDAVSMLANLFKRVALHRPPPDVAAGTPTASTRLGRDSDLGGKHTSSVAHSDTEDEDLMEDSEKLVFHFLPLMRYRAHTMC